MDEDIATTPEVQQQPDPRPAPTPTSSPDHPASLVARSIADPPFRHPPDGEPMLSTDNPASS
ncbi:hypothetical protein PILCRDRAFT_14799 [Piloderma croceum F 1598]|uniref:Uncharacterized protein n=1 Tax=Piloderma croceum (strain F 1598) TaxID=765440 RepID=A0A0C3EN16_PILCF|nr:hypothetical protein PILCRDRAFT_14799 [Piloderma croceum F 1598]